MSGREGLVAAHGPVHPVQLPLQALRPLEAADALLVLGFLLLQRLLDGLDGAGLQQFLGNLFGIFGFRMLLDLIVLGFLFWLGDILDNQ